ncbi:hypothetical protein BGZ65_010861, partial [Modicella reniformis]
STNDGVLDVTDASIQDVRGLSRLNEELLKQRGAGGEPYNRLRASIKKVMVMETVVSKFKQSSNKMLQDSYSTAVLTAETSSDEANVSESIRDTVNLGEILQAAVFV